ncbi:hypothetical protein Tco_0124510, partial [Tanacetum coccineum]
GNAVEGVLGVGGDGNVKSLSSKQISVSNIVSDNDDMVADSNNSKVGKLLIFIKGASKGKYVKFKNGIVVEKKMSAQKPSVPTKKGKHKGKGQTADTGIAECHKVSLMVKVMM